MRNTLYWIAQAILILSLLGWVYGGFTGMLFCFGVFIFFMAMLIGGIWASGERLYHD